MGWKFFLTFSFFLFPFSLLIGCDRSPRAKLFYTRLLMNPTPRRSFVNSKKKREFMFVW